MTEWRLLFHGGHRGLLLFQIIQDNGKVSGSNDTSFQCDGSNATFRVMFKEPIEILPNINYTACATLKVSWLLPLPFRPLLIDL